MQLQPTPNSLFVQRINTPIERVPRNGLPSALLWGCQAESPAGSVLLADLQAWEDEAAWGAFSTLGLASLSPATIVSPY